MKTLKIFLILCSMFMVLNGNSKHEFKYSYKNLDYLNLNDKQIEAIKNILLDLKNEYKKFYEEKDNLEYDLEDIINDKTFDEKLYFQKVMQIKTKATTLEIERIKRFLEVLNEKQKQEFAEHYEEWTIE